MDPIQLVQVVLQLLLGVLGASASILTILYGYRSVRTDVKAELAAIRKELAEQLKGKVDLQMHQQSITTLHHEKNELRDRVTKVESRIDALERGRA